MKADKTVLNLSRVIVLVLGFAGLSSPVYSEETGGITRPGDIQPQLPELGKPPATPIEVETKEPLVTDKKRKAYGAKFFVKEIRITGNTAFTSEALKEITAPYENRVIYNSELEDIRIALTRKYIDHGYINSGAVIPDHKVVNGIVQMTIIEGSLTEIEVIGNDHLNPNYIKKRLKLGASTPLNVNDLQEQIQIILDSPVIKTIKSALRPGDKLGEASLTTLIKESSRFQISPVIDNRVSSALGDTRARLPVQVNNLTGQGDMLSATLGFSDGLNDGNLNWSIPLNAYDTSLSIFGNYSDSEVVNGAFKPLQIANKAHGYGFRVSHPFYRNSHSKFSMSLGMDVRQTESELLGTGFAFTPGVPVDGKVRAAVVRFSQDWTKRELTQVIAARSLFSFGVDAFNATINSNDLPSGEFITWLGQYQWAKLLGSEWGQVIFRANIQFTQDPLFAMEQYSVGGALSVRGYRENQLVRDNGYDVSLEYRYPIMKNASGRSILSLAPFIDAGGSNNTKLPDGTEPDFISSVGVGLRWDPTKNIHAEVYWGHANTKVVNDGNSLQDKGIHFLLSANLNDW